MIENSNIHGRLNKKGFYFIFLLFLCCTCTQKPVSRRDLEGYVEDDSNELICTIERKNISVSATYYPYQLLVSQEIISFPNTKNLDSLVNLYTNLYNKYLYISVSISVVDGDGRKHYPSRDLADAIKRNSDIAINKARIEMRTSKNEQLPLVSITSNDTYGVAAELQLLLAFERKGENTHEDLLLYIEGMYDYVGDKFVFREKNIKKIPAIDYTL